MLNPRDLLSYGQSFFSPTAAGTPIPIYKTNILDNRNPNNNASIYGESIYINAKKYFEFNENARASDENLAISSLQQFNPKNSEHMALIRAHTNNFIEKYTALKKHDTYIIVCLLLHVVVITLPFIPFANILFYASLATTMGLLLNRADLSNPYRDALALLVGTCNWSLGPDLTTRINNVSIEEFSNNDDINRMMLSLYPVLDNQQVTDLIANDIEDEYANARKSSELSGNSISFNWFRGKNNIENNINKALEDAALKKNSAELWRCIYGLNQGNNPIEMIRVSANYVISFIQKVSAGYSNSEIRPKEQDENLSDTTQQNTL